MSAFTGASSMVGGAWVYCESPHMRDGPPKSPTAPKRRQTPHHRRVDPGERLWRMVSKGRIRSLSQIAAELLLYGEQDVVSLVMEDARLDFVQVVKDANNRRTVTIHVVIAEDET